MSTDTASPAVDRIGAYDLLAKLGEGGGGTVYKGRHRGTGHLVAIKTVPPHVLADAVLRKRFEQEFYAAKAINHPNIVQALDYCRTDKQPFLVLELVEGESLGARLVRQGRMPESRAILLIAQVVQGLHRAHQLGLIHRDVKPDNILVTADGVAKLTDLGLVKAADASQNLTQSGRGLGTPHFMAPEQFRNAKSADARCDLYSLGATLYHMVTGQLPFQAATSLATYVRMVNNDLTPPRQLVPALSARVDRTIRRALAADPEQRQASCREFLDDLLGQDPSRAAVPGLPETELDLWYVECLDHEGKPSTALGNTQDLRQSLNDGQLGDLHRVRASRTMTGARQPILEYPQFADAAWPSAIPDEVDPQRRRLPARPGSAVAGRRALAESGREQGGVIRCSFTAADSGLTAPPFVTWLKWLAAFAVAVATALVSSVFWCP